MKRKKTPPEETPAVHRDPTADTARYLRTEAAKLTSCAPKTGARVRVHLEVEVTPKGEVTRVEITNLDPVPGEVASCVDTGIKALEPPAFDATQPEVFALTIVL